MNLKFRRKFDCEKRAQKKVTPQLPISQMNNQSTHNQPARVSRAHRWQISDSDQIGSYVKNFDSKPKALFWSILRFPQTAIKEPFEWSALKIQKVSKFPFSLIVLACNWYYHWHYLSQWNSCHNVNMQNGRALRMKIANAIKFCKVKRLTFSG